LTLSKKKPADDDLRPEYDLSKLTPAKSSTVQKLISIADVCKDGCRFDALNERVDTEVMLQARYRDALQEILKMVNLTNSLSEFRRGMHMIKAVAEEALK
jgi:hypothetical protein